jgi:hypothetical protein
MKFLAPEQYSRSAPGAGPISVEYLRPGLDIGSDPRTLHLAVDQESNKYDGSESATAGKYKVAFVRRVVVALPGHFLSPSARARPAGGWLRGALVKSSCFRRQSSSCLAFQAEGEPERGRRSRRPAGPFEPGNPSKKKPWHVQGLRQSTGRNKRSALRHCQFCGAMRAAPRRLLRPTGSQRPNLPERASDLRVDF